MAVAFPYEAGARAPGVTADAPEVTDEMAIAASGKVPDGMTADEAFGAITEGRSYTQELGEGFQRGQAQTSSMLAMGMETVASALGFDHTAQKFRERSEILDQEAASHPTSVASYTDVKDFESGAKYALGIIGEQAPQLAMDAGVAIGSGGLAAAGSVAFRKGVTAAVVKQAFKTNAWRGMAASQYGQNLGESRKMQLAEGIDDPTTAFTAAAGKTVLDYASSRVMLKSALGLASRGMKNEAMQLIKEGFKSSSMEGITEGMQAAVDHAVIAGSKAGYRMDTQEVADDIINSAIAGFLVGATPSTIQATIQGAQKTGKLTLDMLQKREGRADGQSQTDTTEQDASLSGLPEEAPLPGSAAASVQNSAPVDAEKEDVNAEQTGLPTAESAPEFEAAPTAGSVGQTDLQTDRQPAALWATRSGRVSDNAGVGLADNGTSVPAAAATADEQPALETAQPAVESERVPQAEVAAPAQKKEDILGSFLVGREQQRQAGESANFLAAENAPKERADNRELGAAKVAPVDFLLSQNMATSENDTAELYSEESKKATSSEVEDALNSFVNAHGDKVGSFQITDTPNRDAETDAIFNAVRRGIEKAQRSETRTEILKTSIADPTAAERLEVPQEKLPALKDAARRDQNSTWVTDNSFVYFQDERNANNVFPVYMPDAVIGVLSSPHTMANKTEGDSRTKVATAIGDIISAMADEGYHPITVNSKGETVPFADAYAAAPVAYVGKTALGQSGSRTVTLADLSNPVDKANLIDGPKKELFDGSELAQMNRDILREDKLMLLQRALKHFSASGDTAPAMVIEAIKRRIAALEYTESLRGPEHGGYAASAEAGRRAVTLRGTLVELQKTMRELATKAATDLAKAEADARAAEASLARLAEDVNAGVPEKELLESARDAVRKAAYSKEIADKSAVECSLQNILDLLDSELLELRQDSAARPEEGTRELLAEGKPDAEQESDPLGATKNPANDDLTSALFALRRSEAADERLAKADAREKLTTYQGKKRVPPREADVQAYVEQVRANMQRGTEQVGQEARRVISSDPMLQVGGLLDRVDAVAAEAGITGKVAIVQANLNGRVATVSLQADGALVKVDSAWFSTASPEAREAVLMHELGHVATAQIISAADPKVLQRLRADFDAYRAGLSDGHAYNKNPVTGFDEYLADQFAAYIRGRKVRATSSSGKRGGVEAVFASIKQKLSSLVEAISKFLFGTDRLSGTAVGFQFMDSMFAAARNSKRGAAGSKDFFESWMRQVYDNPERRVRDRKATAEAAGLSTTSGELDARDFDLNKAREAAGGITNAVLGAVKHPLETGRKLAVAADRLHREVPIFITAREELKGISKELMRKYDQVFDGSRADIDAWQQRVHRIFSAIHADPKKEQALADYIAGRAPLPRELRAYLEALYDHVNADLPTLNKVLEFFPRMYDIEAVNNRQDEFLQLLHTAGMSPDAAKNAWHNIVNGKNLYTAEIAPEVSIHGSTFQNAKQRMLTNVSDEVLRQNGFLQNDVHAVLLHYTQKAIRMKHYAREFAQYTHLRHSADSLRDFLPDVMFDDRDTVAARNRKMLSWMLREKVPLFDLRDGHPLNEKEKLQQIKEPSDDNDFMAMNMPFIKQAIKQKWIVPENHRGQVTFAFYDMNAGLRDVVRTLPVEQQRRAAMIIDAYEGRLAADKLSPKARNMMSNIVAYQNLRTMLFSTFTSLADASGLVFKGGDFRGAWENLKAMGEIVGELRRGDKLQLYRDLGYAERQSAMQAFLEAYGIQHQSKASARVNNFLFTWNGQIALTNGIRLMGAALAERHIQRAVKDIKNGTERQKDNAQAMLRDLGLSLDDASALHDGFKRYNHYVDTGTTNTAEGQRAFRLHEAVNKYVDSAITRPDARARPVWGSDPRFMLLYQFKSFVFAYWEKIMKPILAESYRRYGAIEGSRLSKAAAAAAPLAVFVLPTFALSALGLWLRQILQYEVWGDEAPAKQMELPEYTYEVIKRGGILGPFELGFTFVENNAEGRSGVTQLMGPTASHLELLLKGDTQKSIGASVPVFSQIPGLREMAKGMFE